MKKGDVGMAKHFSKKYGNKGWAFDYCRTQNVSGHINLANYSESILSLSFSNANYNVQYQLC